LAIADNYQFYRFTRIKIELLPSTEDQATGTQTSASLAAGYLPGPAPDSPPASEASILALPHANFLSQGSTVPRRITLPRRELVGDGIVMWYKTIAGTPDAQFETQGIIYTFASAAGTITNGVNFFVHYTVEFQGWSIATNTPLAVPKDVSKLDEHHKLLKARCLALQKKNPSSSTATNDIIDIAGIRYLRIDP